MIYRSSFVVRGIFLVWIILTLLIFLSPISFSTGTFKNSDKFYHSLFSFITAFLFYFAFRGWRKVLIGSFIFSVLYGLFLEIVQGFVSYRDFSLADFFADILGAGFFLAGFIFSRIGISHE